jgi:4-hydroxy-tetrahydrodipicolinate synthase
MIRDRNFDSGAVDIIFMGNPAIRGVLPIVVTPFSENGDVDYESLEHLSRTLASHNCDGLALFGYASEFYKLDNREREEMAKIVVDVCEEEDVPSIVSVTAQSTDVAVNEAQKFGSLGADGLMILPPHVRNPSQDAVFEHVKTVAETVDLPIVVQYAPGSTEMTLPPTFFADLYSEVENVDHFKIECDPPGPYIDTLHDLTNDGANILVGRAGLEMIEGYDRGAVGVMPASAMFDIYAKIDNHYRGSGRFTWGPRRLIEPAHEGRDSMGKTHHCEAGTYKLRSLSTTGNRF